MGFCKSGKLLRWQLLNLLLWLLEHKFCTFLFAIGQKIILPDDAAEFEHSSSPSLDDFAFFSQSPLLWLPRCTNGLCLPFKWTRGLNDFHTTVGLNIASVSSVLVDKAWLTDGISIHPKGVGWAPCRHVKFFHNRLCKPISGHSIGCTAMLEWEEVFPNCCLRVECTILSSTSFEMEVIGCVQNLVNKTWPKVYRQDIRHTFGHIHLVGKSIITEVGTRENYGEVTMESKTSRWLIETRKKSKVMVVVKSCCVDP